MSSTGDETSGFFSVHSRPVTRASTVASSLLPPMSEMGPSKYPQPDTTGFRSTDTDSRVEDTAHVRSRSLNTAGKHSTRSRSPLEYGPEPFEEYCSPTRSATSGLNNLQRHRSTKQLINRYEAMEVSALPSRSPRTPVRKTSRFTATTSTTRAGTSHALRNGFRNKKTSPLRHSFRNFLSVFTKNKHSTKEENLWTPNAECTNVTRHMTSSAASDDPFVVPHIITKDLTTEKIACNTPTALRSGRLLYLSQRSTNPLTSPMLPVWTSCTATLHRQHILVTSLSPHGNPSTQMIDLMTCADVRSLALSQISSNEQALLPDKGAGLKVFEVQFVGTQKERFACTSLQERAGWVSAIWDVILKTQEELEGNQPTSPDFPGTLKIETSLPAPDRSAIKPTYRLQDGQDTPSTLGTNPGSSIYSDCSLPPTPTSPATPRPRSPSPVRLALHDSPRGRSLLSGATSRAGSPSHLSPTARSRSKSPSIANLDRLSVVKQRLAQIEQDPSRSSSPSMPSPSHSQKSTRTRELSPLSPTSTRTAFRQEGDLQQLHSLRANAGSTASASCQSSPTRNIYSSKEPSKAKSTSGNEAFESDHIRVYAPPADSQLGQVDEISRSRDVLSMLAEHNRQSAIREGTTSEGDLKDIREKLDDIRRQVNSHSGAPPLGIVQTLEEMQARLKFDLPDIMARLQEMKYIREGGSIKDSSPGNVLHNLEPLSGTVALPLDLSDVHAKLDNLLSMRQPDEDKSSQITMSPSAKAEHDLRSAQALELSAQLNELLSRARSGEAQQSIQSEQQADSARYLNELNTWLATFVDNGTSQIQMVASGVQQLCEELGCSNERAQPPGVYSDVGRKKGLLADIQNLIAENKNRDQNIEVLQAAVNGLVDVVHEDVRQNTEARNAMTIESIMDLINRQRHEHSHMLRGLSTELTNEIRGERLRFVDAMKEATEINVQAHVEQFKKELTREVLVMTQDVGRLHKERQAIEQQIADLFAFYSKQKQSSSQPTVRRGPSQLLTQRQQNVPLQPLPSGRRSSQRRPLPTPLNPWNQ